MWDATQKPIGSHYYQPGTGANIVWQNTSSNATYCSGAKALSVLQSGA